MRWTSLRREGLVMGAACLLLAATAFGQEATIQTPSASEPVAAGAAAPGAPVPVSVLAVAFPIPEAADAQVPVLVEIGGPQLLAGNTGDSVAGEIRGAALDASGQAVQEFTQPFALDPADEALQRAGLKLFAVMRLRAGDYRLRVGVTNVETGAAGSWEGSLRVPDFAAGGTALSPPLFPESSDRWRVFRQSDSPHEGLAYPFLGAGGEAFLPAAAPRVGTTGAPFHVFLYGATTPPQRFEARLVGQGGQPARVPVEVVGIGSGEIAGFRKVALRLGDELPPPGAYSLEVTLGGSWGTGTTRVPVSVVAEQLEAPEALGVVVAAGEPVVAVEEPAVPARNWSREALAQRYRELLVRGSEEGFEAVAGELAETELSATADHKAGQIQALREVQEKVLERIEAGGREALLPVIYLHFLADQALVRRGETWMIAQNRHWISILVRRWAGEDAARRRVGAQILAVAGLSPVAIELDPSNELALLRYAMGAEKSGKFDNASEWVGQLLAAHPESYHARLRQAVLMRRLGSGDEAGKRLFAFVADASAPRWMAVLAYQELAEIQRQERNRKSAEATLRQGIEKLGSQDLYLQLAYYLDDWQRPDEAVSVLNRMPPTSAESSARHIYNAPPEAELAAARRDFEAAMPPGVPQLRLALGAPASSVAGSR